MNATGIIRRIDDLGRIVIPKEFRRKLRIKEGDPLEIFTGDDNDVVIFKRYTPIGEFENMSKMLTALYKTVKCPIVICDTDRVKVAYKIPSELYAGQYITDFFSEIIRDGSKATDNVYPIEGAPVKVQFIQRIVVNGDVYGAVVLLSCNAAADVPIEAMEYGTKFLADTIATMLEI